MTSLAEEGAPAGTIKNNSYHRLFKGGEQPVITNQIVKDRAFYKKLESYRVSRDYAFLFEVEAQDQMQMEREAAAHISNNRKRKLPQVDLGQPSCASTPIHDPLKPDIKAMAKQKPPAQAHEYSVPSASLDLAHKIPSKKPRTEIPHTAAISSCPLFKGGERPVLTNKIVKDRAFYKKLESYRVSRDYAFLFKSNPLEEYEAKDQSMAQMELEAQIKSDRKQKPQAAKPSASKSFHLESNMKAMAKHTPVQQVHYPVPSASVVPLHDIPSKKPKTAALPHIIKAAAKHKPVQQAQYPVPSASALHTIPSRKPKTEALPHLFKAAAKHKPMLWDHYPVPSASALHTIPSKKPKTELPHKALAASPAPSSHRPHTHVKGLARKSTVAQLKDEDEYEDEDEDEDDGGCMVSSFFDIEREEKRSAKIAREEDRRELELLNLSMQARRHKLSGSIRPTKH